MKRFSHEVRLISAIICAVFSFHISSAQYSTLGPLSGSTFSDDNSVGTVSFSSPGNAAASDDVKSSASTLIALFDGDTHYLKVTGFGFSIPTLALVTGIKVEVEKIETGINELAT